MSTSMILLLILGVALVGNTLVGGLPDKLLGSATNPAPSGSGSSGSSSTSYGQATGGATAQTQAQVAQTILGAIGNTSPSQGTLSGLLAWFKAEGGAGPQFGVANNVAAYNPLNTTLPLPGSTNTPGNGNQPVQAYTSWDQGVAATVNTLNQTNFAGIKSVLANNGSCAELSAAVAASNWGTGAFSCGGG